jgi:hypothetical protein
VVAVPIHYMRFSRVILALKLASIVKRYKSTPDRHPISAGSNAAVLLWHRTMSTDSPHLARSLTQKIDSKDEKSPLTWSFIHRQWAPCWSGRQDSNLRPLDPQICGNALSCDNSEISKPSERLRRR